MTITTTSRTMVALILGFSLVGLTYSPPAEAQTRSGALEPSGANQAVKLYEDGIKAVKAGQWEQARDSFLGAWRIKQHWQIAANLGRAELMLNNHRSAAEHLAFFLREAPEGVSADELQNARSLFEAARAKVGAVTINVNVSDAEVRVDGNVVGRAPLADLVFVDPGRMVIEARREGYETSRKPLDVAAGSTTTVELALTKPLPRQSQRTPALSDSGGPNKALVVSGIVVSAAAAGLGVASAIVSYSSNAASRDMLPDKCQSSETLDCRQSYLDHQTDYALFGTLSLWSLIGANLVGVGTAIYAFSAPRSEPTSKTSASVVVNAHGGHLVVTTAW